MRNFEWNEDGFWCIVFIEYNLFLSQLLLILTNHPLLTWWPNKIFFVLLRARKLHDVYWIWGSTWSGFSSPSGLSLGFLTNFWEYGRKRPWLRVRVFWNSLGKIGWNPNQDEKQWLQISVLPISNPMTTISLDNLIEF